jgi:DNA invertase Pin-like site-specific DNA recombinase
LSPAHRGKWISYLRVSTDRQGRSGFGLEAQRQKVTDYLNGGGWVLAAEYLEVESGRRNDRPQLAAALEACKRLKARLIVATMSRLTRDTRALLALKDDSVDVVFCDMPDIPPGAIGRLILTVLAAVNEFEARQTGERTKAALAAAKARGRKLGGPNLDRDRVKGRAVLQARADAFAANVAPIIREVQSVGAISLRAVAAALNARGVKTARGMAWTPVQVRNVMRRVG